MIEGQFVMPMGYELIATFLLATTGAILAIDKKYDISGVLILAVIAGAGGGLLRDGIFLSQVPLFIQNWEYIVAVILAAIFSAIFTVFFNKITLFFVMADALGLGIFGIIATQMSLNAGLSVLAAIFIGLVGAVGGGLLRDVLIQQEPLLLKPGQFYFTAALIGIVVFLMLGIYGHYSAQISAIVSIVLVFLIRMLSIILNWQSFPVLDISQKLAIKKKDK
jgi:uncharacterized membrane protein YeiH